MAVPSTMSTDQDLPPQAGAGNVVLQEGPLSSQTEISTVTSQNDQRGAENPIASHNDADDLPIRDQEDVQLAEALKKSRMEFGKDFLWDLCFPAYVVDRKKSLLNSHFISYH